MTKEEIIAQVRTLNLPENSYIVFGSCPLAAVGIRQANDIDLLVSSEVFESLKSAGWIQVDKGPNDTPLVKDAFEAHDSWNFSSYNPELSDLLKRAMDIDGVPFASLDDVCKWKAASGRPKDLKDLEMIDRYQTSKHN